MDYIPLAVIIFFIIIILVCLFLPEPDNEYIFQKDKSIHVNEPNYYLSVGAIFRNEEHMIDAWIKHHISEGVDHFYMVNDGSKDNSLAIIEPYVKSGIVTLYDVPPRIHLSVMGNVQEYCYNNIILPLAIKETEWLALIDLDEFLYARKDTTAKNALRKIGGGYNQIYVGWLMFGSGDFIEDTSIPRDPITSYTRRRRSDKINNMEVKPIHRPKMLLKSHIHTPTVIGKTMNLMDMTAKMDEGGEEPPLIINHYHLQSKGYWYKVKKTRGDAWFALRQRTKYEFSHKNDSYNEIVDTSLLEKSRNK